MSQASSLKDRVLRSGGWSIGGNLFGQIIRLGGNLLMTRLLFPGDFGLMSIVQVIMVGLTLLSDVGTSQSLIYHPRGQDPKFRNTAWTMQVIRGFGIWLTSLIAAGVIILGNQHQWFPEGSTYNDPRLPLLIAVSSLQMVIQGFQSSRNALAQRQLQLKKLTLLQIWGQVGSLVVMLAWGWYFQDIWALVAGALVAMTIQTILSHTYLDGEPDSFAWDKQCVSELMGFGRWVFLSSVIGFLANGGDRLLLGGLEDAHTVGVYAIAYLLMSPVQTILWMVVGVIIFPALSEVNRDNPARLGETYAKFQRLVDLALMPLAGMLSMLGPAVVHLFYDARYQQAGHMLSLLSLSLIGSRFLVLEQMFKAKGRSDLNTLAGFLRFLALFIGVPLAHRWAGLDGALVAIVVSTAAAWPLAIWYRLREGLPSRASDKWGVPALAAGLLVGWLLSLAFSQWLGGPQALQLIKTTH
jgi:O-antigen/teichoic acid export membrane protein